MLTFRSLLVSMLCMTVVPACMVGGSSTDDKTTKAESGDDTGDTSGDPGTPGDPPPSDGTGGGAGNVIQCARSTPGKSITCTNGACECKINDVVQRTCTAANPAKACVASANCCGF